MKKIYFLFIFSSFIGLSQTQGDLVITEIMNNPSPVSDTTGEWFEIYNTTAAAIDISGWTLKDDGTDTHVIDSSNGTTLVPAGGYLVLGRSSDNTINGGASVNYAYGESGGHTLGNGADEVVLLTSNAVEISRVNYDGGATYPDLTGESMQLDPSYLSETDNNSGSNWCPSTSYYGDGTGSLGTPGLANDECAPVCQASLDSHIADCDDITSGTDSYTVTLEFSGAGTTTFVVNSSEGTVSGDDPSISVTGNIIVSGIAEDNDVIITIDDTATGGICTLTRAITSPVCEQTGSVDLELQGVIDFGLSSSNGKAVHVVATADIDDLSFYGIGVANNGGGSDGQEYTFDTLSVSAGDHILVARSLEDMETYLTTAGYNLFNHLLVATSSISQNGDDAIELYKNGVVVETFGDINCDPNATGSNCTEWEYTDSWAYKTTTAATWPNDWTYGTVGCAVNDTTFDSSCVYPFVTSLSMSDLNTKEISIFPNPVTNGFLSIKSQLLGIKSISIFDINGREVLSTQLDSDLLDVTSINSGFYFITIEVDGASTTKKLIIN
jgi:hypothetical protein